MRQIYLKILIGIICVFWIIYFIKNLNEGFTTMGSSIYRPYIRNMNKIYEDFSNNYSSNIIMTKLKKYKIL
jgi:hypothetical protein